MLDSDAEEFCGHKRVDHHVAYRSELTPWHERPCSFLVYAPSRTVVVYAPEYLANPYNSKALPPISERKAAGEK